MPRITSTSRCGPHAVLALLIAALVMLVAVTGCSTVTVSEQDPGQPVGQIVPARLAIVHTGAIRGSFGRSDESMGLASVARIAHDLEKEGYDVLLVDSGDSLMGSPLVDLSDGEVSVGFLNAAGYDALTVGAGELAAGCDSLAKRRKQSDFMLLSANLRATSPETDHTTDVLASHSQTFTLSDGRKVGVFGITTPTTLGRLSPLVARDLSMGEDDLIELAQQQVAYLRKQDCRLVVCLSNLPYRDGAAPDATDLAQQVSGIDVMLSISEDEAAQQGISDASGEDLLVVGTPSLLRGTSVVLWEQGTLSARQLDAATAEAPDEQVDALVTQTEHAHDEQLAKVVANSPAELSPQKLAQGEAALGDLVTDALLWHVSRPTRKTADAALINLGALEASLPKGKVTRAEVLAVCGGTTRRLCVVRVSGAQLQKALASAIATQQNDLLPQVAGMTVELDTPQDGKASKPTITTVDGKAFSPTTTYAVVTTQELACSLDAYQALREDGLANMEIVSDSAGEALAEYLTRQNKGSLPDSYKKPQGRLAATEPEKADKDS